ncbi:MAG: peptidase family protein [Micavibrio sp.]|nr:peptidase family protein [Micavibrio sp.]
MALTPMGSYAATKAELADLKAKLETEQQEKDELKKKVASVQGDLEISRKDLVGLSQNLQGNEKNLSTLEGRIAKLQEDQAALTARMQADYGSMGELMLALERIRRMPTETLIIRPGAPLETAESAILLRSILPGINARAEKMSKDIAQMKEIQTSLEQDRAQSKKTAAQLKEQQKSMMALLSKREGLFKQTKTEYEEQAESVAKMAAQAQSLEQLVSQVKERPQANTPSRRLSDFKVPGGAWRPPVQGKLLIRFGQRDAIGAASEGLRIAGRPSALVTAPVAGVVRYAGSFRNYGNIVIIEHGGDLHSLIGGLSRIDAQVGQKISAGEPVGMLPASGTDGPPALYYELRHNGKPVDPSAKFPDLS